MMELQRSAPYLQYGLTWENTYIVRYVPTPVPMVHIRCQVARV